jgi:glycosyltransferase involved in cell wall biosynthesis
VVAARDAAATIELAVTTAARQSAAPAQIIVVDDGSRDDTVQRARAAGDVTVLQTPGSGVAAARNEGAAHATGEWIAFLDADDRWDPEHLAAATAAIRAAPGGVACLCAATAVDESGRAVGAHCVGTRVSFADLLTRRVTPTTSGMLVRRDAFDAEGGFFTGFGRPAGVEDLDLWLRLALNGPFIGQQRPLVTYVVQDRRDARRTYEELLTLERDRELVLERLAARGDVRADLLRAGRRALRTGTAHYWLRAGFRGEARRCVRMSITCGWSAEAAITLLAASLPQPVTELGRRAMRRRRASASHALRRTTTAVRPRR